MSSQPSPRPAATPDAATPTDPTPDATVLLCVARTATPEDALRLEQILGAACAEDEIEILDGILINWPPDSPTPAYRPLQNLPRIAAVAAEVWPRIIDDLAGTTHPRAPQILPALSIAPRPGSGAVIAFYTITTPNLAGTPEQIVGHLTPAGSTVITSSMTAASYTRLRHPPQHH